MWLVWTRQEVNKILFKLRKTTRYSKQNQKTYFNWKRNNETEILNQIKAFSETLFQKPSQKHSTDDINHFLTTLAIPKLSTDQIILCDTELTEKDLKEKS